jgi:hypothetical protein
MTNHLYPRDEVEARRGPVAVTDPAITVPTEDLRALFDIAVGSLNFVSGFLDTDEVDVLRRVAVQIGVDPMAGTPKEFALRTAHAFVPDTEGWTDGPCKWCGRHNDPKDYDPHPAAGEVRAP